MDMAVGPNREIPVPNMNRIDESWGILGRSSYQFWATRVPWDVGQSLKHLQNESEGGRRVFEFGARPHVSAVQVGDVGESVSSTFLGLPKVCPLLLTKKGNGLQGERVFILVCIS